VLQVAGASLPLLRVSAGALAAQGSGSPGTEAPAAGRRNAGSRHSRTGRRRTRSVAARVTLAWSC